MSNEQNLLIGVSREQQIEVENICVQKNLTLSSLFEKLLEMYKEKESTPEKTHPEDSERDEKELEPALIKKVRTKSTNR